ncbi:MAG: hypothetical protein OXI71_17645 [Gemmatimonadota bacterium]|nr:hypothetical protein [Gemmatimonadota bacterium]
MTENVALVDPETACTVDTYDVKIVCVERSGGLVATFGSQGEGPGEFLTPTSLVRGIDGTLGFLDRNTFHVVTPLGVAVRETELPVSLFEPISPFGTTVRGTYPSSFNVASFGVGLVAVEIDVETGEILREWRPASFALVDECGAPAFGFPVDGEHPHSSWVFLGCDGYLAFTHGSGQTKVMKAPTYTGETPSERDVTSHRELLVELRRRVEQMTGRPRAARDLDASVEEYAGRAKLYYLQRGQETLDTEGRVWITTSRDRDKQSFLDVYRGEEFYGTVMVRDRMIDFDVDGSTLAVLVERGIGPGDPDGVADWAIDWYDISGFGESG